MGEREARVSGFDSFTGFTNINDKDISASNRSAHSLSNEHGVKVGGFNPGTREYDRRLVGGEKFEAPTLSVINEMRLEIVAGDVNETIQSTSGPPGLRISLLHLDVDLYEPPYGPEVFVSTRCTGRSCHSG